MSDKKEIKVLKDLVRAQDAILHRYRIGMPMVPEWCWDKVMRAKDFYKVKNISDIK